MAFMRTDRPAVHFENAALVDVHGTLVQAFADGSDPFDNPEWNGDYGIRDLFDVCTEGCKHTMPPTGRMLGRGLYVKWADGSGNSLLVPASARIEAADPAVIGWFVNRDQKWKKTGPQPGMEQHPGYKLRYCRAPIDDTHEVNIKCIQSDTSKLVLFEVGRRFVAGGGLLKKPSGAGDGSSAGGGGAKVREQPHGGGGAGKPSGGGGSSTGGGGAKGQKQSRDGAGGGGVAKKPKSQQAGLEVLNHLDEPNPSGKELLELLRKFKATLPHADRPACDRILGSFNFRGNDDDEALSELIKSLDLDPASMEAPGEAKRIVERIMQQQCCEKILVVTHRVAEEVDAIQEKLGPHGDDIVDHIPDITFSAFAKALERTPYQVVQLSMHAGNGKLRFCQQCDEGAAAAGMEDDKRDAKELGRIFNACEGKHPGALRAVLLMACAVQEAAQAISASGVPAVIYCPVELADEVALAFLPEFYFQLVVLHRPASEAFRRAKRHATLAIPAPKRDVSGVLRLELLEAQGSSGDNRYGRTFDDSLGQEMSAPWQRKQLEKYRAEARIDQDERAANGTGTKLEMRDYQRELFECAKDQNTVVYLPTGAGKTLVAAEVIRHCMARRSSCGKIVIFIAQGIPLVFQQARVLEQQLGVRVGAYCGELAIHDWNAELTQRKVAVFTAGLFVELLKDARLSLEEVELLVLDECHHCVKQHPFNVIMKDHFFTTSTKLRPQVLGMSASPATAETQEQTHAKLLDLCKQMDSVVAMPASLERWTPADIELCEVGHSARMDAPKVTKLWHAYMQGLLEGCLERYIARGADPTAAHSFRSKMQKNLGAASLDLKAVRGTINEASKSPFARNNAGFRCFLEHASELCERQQDFIDDFGSPGAAVLQLHKCLDKLLDTVYANAAGRGTGDALVLMQEHVRGSKLYSGIKNGDFAHLPKDIPSEKMKKLLELLNPLLEREDGRAIIFVTERCAAAAVCDQLKKAAHSVDYIVGHGDGSGMGHRSQVICTALRRLLCYGTNMRLLPIRLLA